MFPTSSPPGRGKLLKIPFCGMFAAQRTHQLRWIHPNENGYAIRGPLALAVIDKTLGK
jgi:hypothetical protein